MTNPNSIPEYISKINNPSDLKNIMKNAKDKNREDVYNFAFKRLCKIQGKQSQSDPLDTDFEEVLSVGK